MIKPHAENASKVFTSLLGSDLAPREAYKVLTGIVVPRPIAWISTVSGTGLVNLAPFSAFTMVSNDPPMIGFNVGLRNGQQKDTRRNIGLTNEFVVNIPSWEHRRFVHASAMHFDSTEEEHRALGLELIESTKVGPPRLRDVPVSLECRVSRIVEFGRGGAEFIAGEVLVFHIRSHLLVDGKIDTRVLDPLGRVAGPSYARVREVDTFDPVTDMEI